MEICNPNIFFDDNLVQTVISEGIGRPYQTAVDDVNAE